MFLFLCFLVAYLALGLLGNWFLNEISDDGPDYGYHYAVLPYSAVMGVIALMFMFLRK